MRAVVMSIGTELVTGQTVDTNSAWLSREAAGLGVVVTRHVSVGDDLPAIRREILRAAEEAEVVLITGGLGPTLDDLTRQALAEAMGVPLQLDEGYLPRIEAFFRTRGRAMPEANRVQAMFPAGSTPLENTCGTAPGIRARVGGAEVFVLPGVPREMRAMFQGQVRPVLEGMAAGAVLLVRTLLTFGAGESDIGEKLRDLMVRGRNPAVGTTAREGVVGVRIYARGGSRGEAEELLNADAGEVRARLGPLVFGEGEETLAHAVARLLTDTGRTVAVAESCTGGLIARQLTDIPGSSSYFLEGMVTYANQAKIRQLGVPPDLLTGHGAVSAPVAEAMARGCRQAAGADYALGVTGIAGPGGGTPAKPVGLVFIGLADAAGCRVTEHRFGDFLGREEIRNRAAHTALNRLRLRLMGIE